MFHLAVAALMSAALLTSSGTDAQRAIVAYRSLQTYLYDPRTREYRERVGAKPGAHAWPLSQALAAAIAVSKIAPVPLTAPRRLSDLRAGAVYAASPGGDVYWDDNEWLAQDFLAMGDPQSVSRAHAIFGAVVHAWDNDPTKPCAGGVQWTEADGNDDRNMVSTVNGALVGLQLYAVDPAPQIVYWSRKMLDWVDRCMLGPSGLYWDHIDGAGNVDTTHWSYNQGSLIGALVLLAQETDDPAALTQAEGVADRSLAYFHDRWSTGEPPEFSAVFFRNLLALAAVDHRADYVAAAQAFADAAWLRHRDPRTGLFSFVGPTRLLDQAAVVQVYAALATASASASPAAAGAPS